MNEKVNAHSVIFAVVHRILTGRLQQRSYRYDYEYDAHVSTFLRDYYAAQRATPEGQAQELTDALSKAAKGVAMPTARAAKLVLDAVGVAAAPLSGGGFRLSAPGLPTVDVPRGKLQAMLDPYYLTYNESIPLETAREIAKQYKHFVIDRAHELLGKPNARHDEEEGRPARSVARFTDFTIRTCQICFRDIKATQGVMADHGFQIRGRERQASWYNRRVSTMAGGFRTGSCPGTGFPPFEISCELVRGQLNDKIEAAAAWHREMDKIRANRIVEITDENGKTITPDNAHWQEAISEYEDRVAQNLDFLWSGAYGSVPWYRAVLRLWEPWPADEPARGAPRPALIDADFAGATVYSKERDRIIKRSHWWAQLEQRLLKSGAR